MPNTIAGDEQGIGDQRLRLAGRPSPPDQSDEQQRRRRAWRGCRCPRPGCSRRRSAPPCSRRPRRSRARRRARRRGCRRSAAPRQPASGPPAMNSQSRKAIGTSMASETKADDADRHVALDERQRVAARCACRDAAIAERMPPMIGPIDLEQGPDRGDADHAGAEEAHVGAEQTCWPTSSARRPGRPLVRIGSRIAQAMTRPTSIAMPTEMPTRWPAPIRAKESPPEMPVERRRRRGNSAPPRPRRSLVLATQREGGGSDASSDDDQPQPLLVLLVALARSRRRHFSTSAAATPFRIGQVGIDDERAPQRHREHHAEHAADRGDRGRRPIGKARATSRS